MSELATPIAPVELPKATPLDQATADALAAVGLPLTTQEQVDAVKADLVALPQVQAALDLAQATAANAQTELATALAVIAAKEAESHPSVSPVRALIDQLESFRVTTLNETLNPLLSRALGGEVLADLPVLTLAISGGGE